MSGMINGKAARGAAPGGLNNPLLAQTEVALEARLTPENKADYDKVLVAGLHVLMAKGPDGYMAKLHNSDDPIGDAAKGAVALVMIMQKDSRGVLPMQAGIPAGLSLLLYGLDFIDRAGIVKIAEPELDRATTLFTNNLFQKLGITPEMLQHATAKVHEIAKDPDAMEKIKLKAGLTRHAGAATATPIPGLPST